MVLARIVRINYVKTITTNYIRKVGDTMIKEKLVLSLQRAGYDTFTACELADDKIAELKHLPSGTKTTFTAGQDEYTIIRK